MAFNSLRNNLLKQWNFCEKMTEDFPWILATVMAQKWLSMAVGDFRLPALSPQNKVLRFSLNK